MNISSTSPSTPPFTFPFTSESTPPFTSPSTPPLALFQKLHNKYVPTGRLWDETKIKEQKTSHSCSIFSYSHDGVEIVRQSKITWRLGDLDTFYDTTVTVDGKCVFAEHE